MNEEAPGTFRCRGLHQGQVVSLLLPGNPQPGIGLRVGLDLHTDPRAHHDSPGFRRSDFAVLMAGGHGR
jgi:hypothetical protein